MDVRTARCPRRSPPGRRPPGPTTTNCDAARPPDPSARPPRPSRRRPCPRSAPRALRADRQLVALDSQRDRLTAATGGLPAARDERDALDRREGQLQREAHDLRDQLAERDVVAPPAWARETFGERAVGARRARGRAVARYRVEHDVADEIPGLGPEPADQHVRGAWRQAATVIAEVQKRLGRSVDRGAGLEL